MTKHSRKHPLSKRHNKQIGSRITSLRYKMSKFWAMTWRPGDGSDSFLGKLYRPFGVPLHVSQFNYVRMHGKRHVDVIPLLGFRASQDQNGRVEFGGEANCRFLYDFAVCPYMGAAGRDLNPRSNSSVIRIGLALDEARERAVNNNLRLSDVPSLPEVFYGFSAGNLPAVEDTPAARQYLVDSLALAAMPSSQEKSENDRLMLVTADRVATMSHTARLELLAAHWEALFLPPNHKGNNTGLYLLHHQFFTRPSEAIRTFECFSHLTGKWIYNPVRALIHPDFKVANPAIQVGKKLGIAVGRSEEDPAYTPEEVDKLVKEMRKSLGRRRHLVSDEALFAGIDKPFEPLVPDGHPDPLKEFGEEGVIPLLRAAMPQYADCCTDADLLEAARRPNQPLWAAGLPKVVVMATEHESVGKESLQFRPDDLGDRTYADFWSVPQRWCRAANSAST